MSCMCKKAIVLLGKPNSGKTTTLREVAKQLLAMPGAVLKNSARCLKCLTKVSADITIVVEVGGKIILVRSFGDDEHEIVYTLKLIAKYHCDIAIFAVSMPQYDGGRKAVYQYYRAHQREIAKKVIEISALRAESDSQIEIKVRQTAAAVLAAVAI